jgi:pSer/pThr/pTyr-binding forkhead associated (FHA) protein
MRLLISDPHATRSAQMQDILRAQQHELPLLVYRDADGVQRIAILETSDGQLWLGRSESCEIALEWDDSASRTHAELVRAAGSWTIVDDGVSTNGTYVNGQRIAARKRLFDGDAIRVGSVMLEFHTPSQRTAMTRSEVPGPTDVVLTAMQKRVLVELCRPMLGHDAALTPATNREIAEALVLSPDAIKTHMRSLFARFELQDLPQNAKRMRLAERALASGLIMQRDIAPLSRDVTTDVT